MDKPEIDHARIIIDALRAYYGKGKTKLADGQIAEGLEHYRPKAKLDTVMIDELPDGNSEQHADRRRGARWLLFSCHKK